MTLQGSSNEGHDYILVTEGRGSINRREGESVADASCFQYQ